MAVRLMPAGARRGSINPADLAAVTERVRRRLIRWLKRTRLLDAEAAADMLGWEHSGFSIDASVRIALVDRDVPSYFKSLEHLLRYCARPPFALERLSDLVPPPRKHRHRYHGVFAPNHPLRPAVTALAIGNIGKRHEAAANGHARDGHGTRGCCDTNHATQKPRSHDTSRIAWAKLMARVGEEFPLECPICGGDIRLITFITEPGPIRKILTHLGEPLEPPPLSLARGPPTDWGEFVQIHDDRDVFQASPDELPAIDIHNRL
ncbi:MAG: transposase [Planctomycetes bacterium]|nr:transposase [Planctomycetota bacterium]